MNGKSGQVLLIMIGVMLILLISIPTIVFINTTGIRHQTQSQKLSQGRAIAEEGISYAAAQLSATPTSWATALSGTFPADCNTSATGHNVAGTNFRLTCSNNATNYPGLQSSYQIAVVATAWLPGPDGQPMATKSLQVFLNQRTLGAYTASGIRAPAALELMRVPVLQPNSLYVQWGPIVCLDSALWTLVNPLDQYTAGTTFQGFPRKFSVGPIAGQLGSPYPRSPDHLTSAITTDNKEYWAYTAMDFPGTVNEFDYWNTYAQHYTSISPALCGNCTQSPAGSGYFTPIGTNPATFTGTPTPVFTGAGPTKVIYVNGSADWTNFDLDMGSMDSAFIVNGDLTLDTNVALALQRVLNVPSTAPLEYPYRPIVGWSQWPSAMQCNSNPGAGPLWKDTWPTCAQPNTTTGGTLPINFRGFLWVKGNLIVKGAWALSGVILVGDPTNPSTTSTLTINPGGVLSLYYDEQVNRTIHMNPR